MDYKNKLSYLYHLQFVGRKFGYLDLTLTDMLEKKRRAEANLKWSQKQWLAKIFDKEFYYNRVYNNRMELDRITSIVQIFEANPNKSEFVTLERIVEDAISKAKKHVSKEEIDLMHHNDSIRSFYRGGDRNIGISAVPENVYFEDEKQIADEPTNDETVESRANRIKQSNNEFSQ